jgi:hypothetical protein
MLEGPRKKVEKVLDGFRARIASQTLPMRGLPRARATLGAVALRCDERFPKRAGPSLQHSAHPHGTKNPVLCHSMSTPNNRIDPSTLDDQALVASLHRVRSIEHRHARRPLLLRHAQPDGDLARIIERGLELLIEPQLKRRFGATDRPRKAKEPAPTRRTRHIPNAVRRAERCPTEASA